MSKKQKESKIYKCPPEEVIVPDVRQRKNFDQAKLKELAESFRQYGQIQPGVCRMVDGRPVLVAGERRLRAAHLAEIEYSYILLEEIEDEDLVLEIELEENLCRVNLTWQEEVDAIQRLHELHQKREGKTLVGSKGGHGVRDTARILDKSTGKINEALKLAAYAAEIDEVANAATPSEAKKVIKRMEEEYKREFALKKAMEAEEDPDSPEFYTTPKGEVREPTKEDIERDLQNQLKRYTDRTIHGEMMKELKKFKDGHFNLVIFDPPWGVDFDKVKKESHGTKPYKDDKEFFTKNFPDWIKLIEKKMAEDSILFLFFGIANYPFVYDTLEGAGFSTNRMPLIWHKKGAHHTRNPKIWFGRSYEPIAYCRKGSKDLQLQGAPDIITTSPPTPKMKSLHPSAKHPDIYRTLLRRAAFPGDKVLDPMAGSGMLGVACESLLNTHQLDWTMIEQEESFYSLSLSNLMKGYENIVGASEADPVEKWGGKTYKDIEIGGEEWMEYWKDFPEQQEDMIKWQANNNNT